MNRALPATFKIKRASSPTKIEELQGMPQSNINRSGLETETLTESLYLNTKDLIEKGDIVIYDEIEFTAIPNNTTALKLMGIYRYRLIEKD